MPKEKKQTYLLVAGTVIIAFFMIWINTYIRQSKQFKLGEKYYQSEDYSRAITAYESALHMYTPFSSKIEKSAQKLWDIGQMFERKNNIDMALIAYRSLRSSFYAVRWLVTPGQEWIKRCEDKIDQLVKKQAEEEERLKEELRMEELQESQEDTEQQKETEQSSSLTDK